MRSWRSRKGSCWRHGLHRYGQDHSIEIRQAVQDLLGAGGQLAVGPCAHDQPVEEWIEARPLADLIQAVAEAGSSAVQTYWQLLLDRLGQKASQGSRIRDVKAQKRGADEFHRVAIPLHHQIGNALQRWLAEQDGTCIRVHRLAHVPELLRQAQSLGGIHRPPAFRASTVRWSVGYTVITLDHPV